MYVINYVTRLFRASSFRSPEAEAAFQQDTRKQNRVFVRWVMFFTALAQLMIAVTVCIAKPDRIETMVQAPLLFAGLSALTGMYLAWDPSHKNRLDSGVSIFLYGSLAGWTLQSLSMSVMDLDILADVYLALAICAGCILCSCRSIILRFFAVGIVTLFVNFYAREAIAGYNSEVMLKTAGIGLAMFGIGLYFDGFARRYFQAAYRLRIASQSFETMAVEANSANFAKSQFLAVVSHELRSPLNAVIGFAQIIETDALGPAGRDRYQEYASDIESSAQHLLKIIDDIIDHSRFEIGKYELEKCWESLSATIALVSRVARENSERGGLEFSLDYDPRLSHAEMEMDATRIRQALLNVLTNAIKFTPSGGHVKLSVTLSPTNDLVFIVSDNGLGMSKEQAIQAVEPFQQIGTVKARGAEGLGIGLCLTKRTIEAHGGSLHIDSEPGKGTSITLTLPGEDLALYDEAA